MSDLIFMDFDHENERHATLTLMPGCQVIIDRRIEVNEDYLDADAEAPDEWSDLQTLDFASLDAFRAFVIAITEELLDICFEFYTDTDQIDDSDEAREIISSLVDAYDDAPTNPEGLNEEAALALVDDFTSYPR